LLKPEYPGVYSGEPKKDTETEKGGFHARILLLRTTGSSTGTADTPTSLERTADLGLRATNAEAKFRRPAPSGAEKVHPGRHENWPPGREEERPAKGQHNEIWWPPSEAMDCGKFGGENGTARRSVSTGGPTEGGAEIIASAKGKRTSARHPRAGSLRRGTGPSGIGPCWGDSSTASLVDLHHLFHKPVGWHDPSRQHEGDESELATPRPREHNRGAEDAFDLGIFSARVGPSAPPPRSLVNRPPGSIRRRKPPEAPRRRTWPRGAARAGAWSPRGPHPRSHRGPCETCFGVWGTGRRGLAITPVVFMFRRWNWRAHQPPDSTSVKGSPVPHGFHGGW